MVDGDRKEEEEEEKGGRGGKEGKKEEGGGRERGGWEEGGGRKTRAGILPPSPTDYPAAERDRMGSSQGRGTLGKASQEEQGSQIWEQIASGLPGIPGLVSQHSWQSPGQAAAGYTGPFLPNTHVLGNT